MIGRVSVLVFHFVFFFALLVSVTFYFFFLLLWFFGFGFVLFRCPNDVVGNVSAARGLCQYWHNTLFTRSQAGQEGGAKEERSEQRR